MFRLGQEHVQFPPPRSSFTLKVNGKGCSVPLQNYSLHYTGDKSKKKPARPGGIRIVVRELSDRKIEIPIGTARHTHAHADFALAKNPHATGVAIAGARHIPRRPHEPNQTRLCSLACLAPLTSLIPFIPSPPVMLSPRPYRRLLFPPPTAMAIDRRAIISHLSSGHTHLSLPRPAASFRAGFHELSVCVFLISVASQHSNKCRRTSPVFASHHTAPDSWQFALLGSRLSVRCLAALRAPRQLECLRRNKHRGRQP